MQLEQIKNIVEAALLAADKPLSLDQLANVFGIQAPDHQELRAAVLKLEEEYANRGIMIAEVASGFRVQVRASMTEWVSRLWEERPPRYSRALLETLALIAYRQPITRGEIEEVRGVSVSTNIMRTLSERGWIRVVGHRDVPGRPAMYATTKEFLDYFGLRRLDELPPLSELRDLDDLNVALELEPSGEMTMSVIVGADEKAQGTDPGIVTKGFSTAADNAVSVEPSAAEPEEGAPDEALSMQAPTAVIVPLKKPGSV